MKRFYSIIALIIIALMFLTMFSGIILSNSANASSVDSKQEELEKIAKEKERLEKELKKISDKKKEELAKKSLIDEQINATQSEISILNGILSELDSELDEAESALEAAEKVLDEKLSLSKARIRSTYEQGDASYLSIIAESGDLYDFISKIEIVNQISAKDKQVIDEVSKNRDIIEVKQKEIKANKDKNEKTAKDLRSKEKTLEKKQDASNQLIDEMNSDAEATKRAVLKAEAAEEQLQAEIRQMLSQSNNSDSSGVIDTGNFRWPLDSKYTNITSKFGYRTHPVTGVYKLHTGVDIASSGIRGAKIYAAKGGTVKKAGYNTGYGNYVLIDHGDGYATLYAHASQLTVSTGQTVSKGDVLGYVGSTGYSTGPHLHFEVMKNGDYVNPLSFFSGQISFTYY